MKLTVRILTYFKVQRKKKAGINKTLMEDLFDGKIEIVVS